MSDGTGGIIERRRISEHDCLAAIRCDLERQAATVKPWQADEWQGWMQACGELLVQVPDELQRVAWAWSMGQPVLRRIVGLPHDMLTGVMLARAAAIRKVGA